MSDKSNMIKKYNNATPGMHNAIKTLCANIWFSSNEKEIKTLVVTSSQSGEGKTTLTTYLAIAMADSGKRTLLINTDSYKPILSSSLGKQSRRSWMDYLYGFATLEEVIVPTEQENLYVMEAGRQYGNAEEVIGTSNFAAMVDQLREEYDMVIFDTCPVNSFIEVAYLAAKADGTIFVISSGRIDGRKAKDTIEQLRKANANVLGVVLNKVKTPDNDYYGYYQYRDRGSNNSKKRRKPWIGRNKESGNS